MEWTCRGKRIRIYGKAQPHAPAVYLNAPDGEGRAVYEQCLRAGCPAFHLVEISQCCWNRDLSPWPAPPVARGGEPFTGGADAHVALLTQEIMPAAEERLGGKPAYSALVGYSLAGLFAVYACYRTDAFARVASASGSFWYPGFVDYATKQAMRRIPEKIYFSLGDREARMRNPVLSTVEEKTRALHAHYARQGIDGTLIRTPGNHFYQTDARMAQGIRWILADGTEETSGKAEARTGKPEAGANQ